MKMLGRKLNSHLKYYHHKNGDQYFEFWYPFFLIAVTVILSLRNNICLKY